MSCICDELCDRYDDLHKELNAEMKEPVDINDIVNHSYCVSTISLPTDKEINDFSLDPTEVFDGLKAETGVYLLWEKVDYCADHPEQAKIRCTYVGETGTSIKNRVVWTHLKDKWNPNEEMWVTFYPCKKRIAVYLEQLLLDFYSFEHNGKNEKGTVALEVFYPQELLDLGTNSHETAELLAEKYPDDFGGLD